MLALSQEYLPISELPFDPLNDPHIHFSRHSIQLVEFFIGHSGDMEAGGCAKFEKSKFRIEVFAVVGEKPVLVAHVADSISCFGQELRNCIYKGLNGVEFREDAVGDEDHVESFVVRNGTVSDPRQLLPPHVRTDC